jgi:outer membrane protein TolC
MFMLSVPAFGLSFNEALKRIDEHEKVKATDLGARVQQALSLKSSSLSDPNFKIAAKNFPKDSLKRDESPMTGIEVGLSQKLPLTNRLGHERKALEQAAKSYEAKSSLARQGLIKLLWDALIERRKILEQSKIIKENLAWINKNLKVSKKLYANGKSSQQAVLDIQIRKSELESELAVKEIELDEVRQHLKYLVGSEQIDRKTIPWKNLQLGSASTRDFRLKSYSHDLNSLESSVRAAGLSLVPDVTLSLSYTKRSNVDSFGDFASATISFPLPFAGKKYASKKTAVMRKAQVAKELGHYKRIKQKEVGILEREIKKISTRLNILTSKTIKFASSSRTITSKSYSLGRSSYVELLQSELKLQKILMSKAALRAKRDMKKAELKYRLGEPLDG